MNISEVEERVEKIRATAGGPVGDPEMAHEMEDNLQYEVLLSISEGTAEPSPAALAAAALVTGDIEFSRWCA